MILRNEVYIHWKIIVSYLHDSYLWYSDVHFIWFCVLRSFSRFFSQMVVNLAMIVYRALDFAQPEDEERLVSPDLENLITDMTADDGKHINNPANCQ